MKVSVIGSSHANYVANKRDFDLFSGKVAGVCYMPNSFENLIQEEETKTDKRIAQTKNNGHHSVYDHNTINLYLEDIPKALAMVLNNEKMYTTSEKSARYTKMVLKEEEQKIYDKWLAIFKDLIAKKYQEQYPSFFSNGKIEKLAQENARYLISVFTPTSMVYSVSYRQLNYLYCFLKKEIEKEHNDKFSKMLVPYYKDLCKELDATGFVDEVLQKDMKGRTFSFIKQNSAPVTEYYGDVYITSYKGSFAQLAQAQRHRTLCYNIEFLDEAEFYIPPILKTNNALVEDWLADCKKQADCLPQGMLIKINESGTLENFVLKMLERKCTFAQLEINQQTSETLKVYVKNLKETNHPRKDELDAYTKGSRCTFPGYVCTSPCGFAEGITEKREI